MIELLHITPNTNLGYKSSMLGKYYTYDYEELILLDVDHMLYISYSRGTYTYAVTNAKSKVTLVLSTIKCKGYQRINVVEAKKNNTYSAVKLYAYLIKTLGIVLVTDKQSTGGKRVWQSLSKVKGINIHGWDFSKECPVNTDKFLKDIDDLYTSEQHKRYHTDIARVSLVAHAV